MYLYKGRIAGNVSQMDHILCDANVTASLGEGRVLPGLSEHDHKPTGNELEIDLLSCRDDQAGPRRKTKLPL